MVSNSASPLAILLWAITGIVSMACLLGNGFISVVLGQQWLRNRKMLTCDCLLISLSTSRFMMQLLFSMNSLLYHISSETYVNSSRQAVVNVFWMFFNMASLWCATWLSCFYCVKVTNFANCVFLWLKQRINMLIPRLLGISVVISSVFFLPPLVEYFGHKKWGNRTESLPGSIIQSGLYHNIIIIFLPLHSTYTCINFTLTVIATILLLVSLWKHTKNLKKSGAGVKDINTQVHINVIILMLFYVFFYVLYFTSMIVFSSDVIRTGSTERLVMEIVAIIFPSAHSIILISTNPKLKEMAARILNIRQRAS
ncbi:taste receptor type 2 member 8-like [Sceloporus undulatus]|uniref:taste receptor type 2 member 8-like n=1 Tax=Sceloporus undulatus TaxID=8520 RepID=UPI001C4AD1A3|nr:taste receptor type 2 member 8-like [Sceloporus undulatus]